MLTINIERDSKLFRSYLSCTYFKNSLFWQSSAKGEAVKIFIENISPEGFERVKSVIESASLAGFCQL